MRNPSETISIRLDQEQLKRLDQRRKPFGDSRGEHIKRMAIATLLEVEKSHTSDMLMQLRATVDSMDDEQNRQMKRLNEKLCRLAYALLNTAGRLSPEEAERAARKIFPVVEGDN